MQKRVLLLTTQFSYQIIDLFSSKKSVFFDDYDSVTIPGVSYELLEQTKVSKIIIR